MISPATLGVPWISLFPVTSLVKLCTERKNVLCSPDRANSPDNGHALEMNLDGSYQLVFLFFQRSEIEPVLEKIECKKNKQLSRLTRELVLHILDRYSDCFLYLLGYKSLPFMLQ